MLANIAKMAKVTRIFLNNKFKKFPDLERKEANKGSKMSANIAKIAKVTKIFLAC